MADNETMYVGDKRVHIGDHVRIVKAHSLLYYEYGMAKEKSECPEYEGIEGTVLRPSDYNDYSVCMIKVHNPLLATRFDRGEMRLFKEDEIQIYDKDTQCKRHIPILDEVVTYDYLKNLIEHYIYDVRMEGVQRGAIYAKFKGRGVDSFYTPGQCYYLNTHMSSTHVLIPQISSLWVYDIHNTDHKLCYQSLEQFLCEWDIIRGPEEEKKQNI